MRIGFGYDVHPFADGRKFILGGVEIPFEKGLEGHSDADALCHAITDALLGAMAWGDIGKHFPDTDERYKNISSLKILEYVEELFRNKNVKVVNIDTTIVLEKPKLARLTEQMCQKIAEALNMSINQVSIKATTSEKMGFVGTGKGIACYAVALVEEGMSKD